MTIPKAAVQKPIPAHPAQLPWVDKSSGLMTQAATQQQSALIGQINGAGRHVPCAAAGTNVITLTPNNGAAAPKLTDYRFGDQFSFVAANNSTGSVTALVAAPSGNLTTIKVYKTNGSAQAGNGDITAGLHYIASFVPTLDSGAGGLVLR